MALNREKKEKIISDLKKKIEEQKGMVFVSINGLKADDLFSLRKELRKSDCLLLVVKKTLMNVAFQESNIDYNKTNLIGQLALVFGFNDELAPAKISYEFSKKNENLKILGGFFDNKFIEKEQVVQLAKIPSRRELIAKLIGTTRKPIADFVSVLQGNIKGLINVLAQKAEL